MSSASSASDAVLEKTPLQRWLLDYVLDDDACLTYANDSTINPMNWSARRKLCHTAMFGAITFAAQLNSTTMSTPQLPQLFGELFGVSREVSLLPTTFYVLGIAFGPMVFAPLSEVYGRKIGVLLPFLASAVFTFVVACSSTITAIIFFRFLAGFCAGAPVVSSGGVLADIWHPKHRGMALAFYAFFVANGPSYGPTISSLLIEASPESIGWRNPQYFSGALNVILFVVCLFLCSETFAPVLLARAAKRMRIETRNWAIHGSHDEWQLTAHEMVSVHLLRPFRMLVSPVILVIALFASYVFGVYYLLITGLHEIFSLTRGWLGTVSTLPNIALSVGVSFGLCVNIWWGRIYGKKIMANNGQPIPEQRFPPLMYFGWLMPAGIFMTCWSSWPDVPWIVPCIGILLTGLGFVIIFQGCLNYLVDTYRRYAASAIAANTILRSIFAAVFPLFSTQLFDNLGVHWGGSLVGFIALAMIPIPWVFFRYGERLRERYPLVLEMH